MPAPRQDAASPADQASDAERLRYQLEDMQRKLDAQARETRAKDETGRRLEQKFRDLNGQIRELEQRAGAFHREASAATEALRLTEETLKICDLARGQLSAALERQSAELERAREEIAAQKLRAEELQTQLHRRDDALERVQKQYEEACKLLAAASQTQTDKKQWDAEKVELLEAVRRERESAEAVRRDGIEALEQARELERRRQPPPKA